VELKDRWVNFRIRDVYLPDPQVVLVELFGSDLLQGQVVDLSDSGRTREAFAVVKVDGLSQPLVVPVDRILGVV
jgi:hypothetical protein